MATVLCVLYDDPIDGYPPSYARDDVPKIERYDGGQTTPTPSALGFTPGELVGCVSGELGLRDFLESLGHGRDLRQGWPRLGVRARATAR
jgi:formate dehydrogenase